MGILQWLTERLGKDLDARVHGDGGVAHARFAGLLDEPPLRVTASVSSAPDATVAMTLSTQPRDEEGTVTSQKLDAMKTLDVELGPGKRYRGSELTLEAIVRSSRARPSSADRAPLVALTLELRQAPAANWDGGAPTLESYSVESRLDGSGSVKLTLVVRLG